MADPSLENDDVLTAEAVVLVEEPDPKEIVLRIKAEEDTIDISRETKQAMVTAIEINANQSTLFFKCLYVITAACKMLNVDLYAYCFPQTDEALEEFDWNEVVPGRIETYPKGVKPTTRDFVMVAALHGICKEEKDKEAIALGFPKSGVQSYITFKQKWNHIRFWCSVYRHMNPTMNPETVLALMQVELKLCTSVVKIEEAIKDSITKHIVKLKREAKKIREQKEVEVQLNQVLEDERQADEELQEVVDLEAELAKEREEVVDESAQIVHGTRRQREQRKAAALLDIQRKEQEVQEGKTKTQQLKEELAEKKQELQKRKAISELPLAVKMNKKNNKPVKVAKRHDKVRLNEAITPRKVYGLDGPDWKPPTRTAEGIFEGPGERWEQKSCGKIHLLIQLSRFLKEAGLVELPPTFETVMEFIGADSDTGEKNLAFFDRVFIHLIALMLKRYMYVTLVFQMVVLCCQGTNFVMHAQVYE